MFLYVMAAGPMVVFHLWHSQNKDLIINFEIPVRQSFATNLRYLKPVGLFSVPYLNIIHSPPPNSWNWKSEFSISPMYADQKFHQHFYGVDKEFARTERPSYRARGGHSGFQTALILNKRVEIFAIGGVGLFWLFN